jgi:AAA ATPase domain
MSSSIGTAWLTPTSIEPRLFANRDRERQLIEDILEDLLQSHARRYRLVISGERGIGKSILTRVACQNFARKHSERVIRVEVNGRSVKFRQFLKSLAAGLVENAKPLLKNIGEKANLLERWLDELALLAHNDQITEGQVRTITTKYGIGAQIGGSLFDVLTGSNSFSWEQSRLASGTTSRTQQVTDDLLHDSLKATFQKLHDETPLLVLVFFDDLDQSCSEDDASSMKSALKRVLDVDPCIGVVHMRSEMLFDDLRREMDRFVEVGPLSENGLLAIINKRLDAALPATKGAVNDVVVQGCLRRLTNVTGNPLVFLRWVQAFFQTGRWLPGAVDGWNRDEALLDATMETASAVGIDRDLLLRVARIVDRCVPKGKREIQKAELLAGRLATDTVADGVRITEEELRYLLRTGALVPVDRFREDTAYRLDSMLDLLRPSIAKQLREG